MTVKHSITLFQEKEFINLFGSSLFDVLNWIKQELPIDAMYDLNEIKAEVSEGPYNPEDIFSYEELLRHAESEWHTFVDHDALKSYVRENFDPADVYNTWQLKQALEE